MSVDPFRFGSSFDDLIAPFFGGGDPFGVLGCRQGSPQPAQRVDLSGATATRATEWTAGRGVRS